VHKWLDSWSGLGLVVAGMTHHGCDVRHESDSIRPLTGRRR
jgi:hypothetical protein